MGPPGTGKTLIAEAVAGETENPFVFVDPGAFNNMFMGVGISKVKGLFRRLCKLALRYGGVVGFFDEADSLGNRGVASIGRSSVQMTILPGRAMPATDRVTSRTERMPKSFAPRGMTSTTPKRPRQSDTG